MILEALEGEILDVARQHDYLPPGELPSVPGLERFERELVDCVLGKVDRQIRSTGIGEEETIRLFRFVFLRAFDVVYRRSEGGGEEIALDLSGKNPLRDDRDLCLPAEVEVQLRELPAPRILYSAMMRWMDENRWRLEKAKADPLAPLDLSLSRTFRIGVAMARKIFGGAD